MDTSQYLTIREGEVFYSQIVDILIGEKGQPGELRGIFSDGSEKFGRLDNNNEFGIFGKTYASVKNPIYPALPFLLLPLVSKSLLIYPLIQAPQENASLKKSLHQFLVTFDMFYGSSCFIRMKIYIISKTRLNFLKK
jgi:hypothetical protein